MRILLVEDNRRLNNSLTMSLTEDGYAVDAAFTGLDGEELAEMTPYDAIILDIMLPGLNGMEVLRRIRRSSSVPVIMLTARDTTMDKVTGLDGGADDYMTKPFEIEELLARIRNALRKKNGSVQPQSLVCLWTCPGRGKA
jgi:DNA-binding response OmpR family regulator